MLGPTVSIVRNSQILTLLKFVFLQIIKFNQVKTSKKSHKTARVFAY
jgi:hypothetical protein